MLIDTLLRSENRPTTGKLAQVLEVSDAPDGTLRERTIRNDLTFLRDRFNAPYSSYSADVGFLITFDVIRR